MDSNRADTDFGVLLVRPRSPRAEAGPLKGPWCRFEPDRGHLITRAKGPSDCASALASAVANEQSRARFSKIVKWLSAKEPEAAANFVLANDSRGVPVADAMLVGQPVSALVATQEGGARFQVAEPLG